MVKQFLIRSYYAVSSLLRLKVFFRIKTFYHISKTEFLTLKFPEMGKKVFLIGIKISTVYFRVFFLNFFFCLLTTIYITYIRLYILNVVSCSNSRWSSRIKKKEEKDTQITQNKKKQRMKT